MNSFRIFLFSSACPAQLHHLLRRVQTDLPEVVIAGILHWEEKRSRGARAWLRRAVAGTLTRAWGAGSAVLHGLLRWFHAAPKMPNGKEDSWEAFQALCASRGIPFQATEDPSDDRSQCFLHEQTADLGVIVGPRTPRPELLTVPHLGTVAVQEQQPAGCGQSDSDSPAEETLGTSTCRRIVVARMKDGKVGGIVAAREFRVELYDTPTSVELKSRLLGMDCLVDAVRAESGGGPGRGLVVWHGATSGDGRPSPNRSSLRGPAMPKRFRPVYSRPFYKLAPRLLVYPALRLRNRRLARRRSFPVVILFHHVITDRPKFLGMATDQFWKHVRFLKKHYRIVSLPEAIEMLRRGEVPAPTVVLTFDDGYEDNFLCLRAVAEAENIPVSLFICTEKVAQRASFQHDLDRGETGFPALGWDQVRYLDRHNVTIGSHTRTHLDCGSTDEEMLAREIVGSREDLRRELGHDVAYFTFPKGWPTNMSQPALTIAQQTYPYLFSACGGTNVAPLTPGCVLKRYVHPDSLLELELMVQSVLDLE